MKYSALDFDRINGMTKYPSILTYHQLGDKGRLTETVQVPFDDDDEIIVTEKVDGTNARIIYLPDNDFLIGSREDLLHAKNDRISIPVEGIVNTVCYVAYKGYDNVDNIVIVFGEVFGGKTGKPKNYTGKKNTGFRIFDVVSIPPSLADEVVEWPRDKIALWRNNGGQPFVNEDEIQRVAIALGQEVTPRLATLKGSELPKDVKGTWEWLHKFSKTKCRLDDGASAKSEGVVVRTKDRSKIAKIRFENYERTMKVK